MKVEESVRLSYLRAVNPPFENLDRAPFKSVTKLARRIFDVPIASVNLIYEDAQWTKASSGNGVRDGAVVPREHSFCAHTLLPSKYEVLVVQDAHTDPRFAAHQGLFGAPLVRFYCGVPLIAHNGIRLGALCVIDSQPRRIDGRSVRILIALAELVVREFKQRTTIHLRRTTLAMIERGRWFAHNRTTGVAILDVKAPQMPILWWNTSWIQQFGCVPFSHEPFWDFFKPTAGHRDGVENLQKATEVICSALRRGVAATTHVHIRRTNVSVTCCVAYLDDVDAAAIVIEYQMGGEKAPLDDTPDCRADAERFVVLRAALSRF